MMWAAPWGRMGRQEGTNLTLEQRRKYNKGRGSCYLFAHLARAVADKFGKEEAQPAGIFLTAYYEPADLYLLTPALQNMQQRAKNIRHTMGAAA